MATIASQRLYLARVCSVRAVETVRLGRTAVLLALLLQASERKLGVRVSLTESIAGATLSFALLGSFRDGYRAWLKAHRRQGRHSRPIVVVGANEEGYDLYRLIGDHPELGYTVCGVVGNPSEVTERGYDVPWLGDIAHVAEAVSAAGANGVLVAASALPSTQLNKVVRDLLVAGVHVHLSSGIRGIDYRRVRSHPLAHEPLFYLEPVSLARWQMVTKRATDLVLAGIGLVLAAPVLAACALAIKASDKGPVFFRQERVGLDGRMFTILKLRTMVIDAEARLEELASQNQREGVLFKLANDPRVTRVGRLLRATSLDELPQLINVVRGDMSLVGPRPALPIEVAQFDEALLARQRVRPGITGLWQVEARDSASFSGLPAARPLLRGELVGQPRPGHPPLHLPDRGQPDGPGRAPALRPRRRQRHGLLAPRLIARYLPTTAAPAPKPGRWRVQTPVRPHLDRYRPLRFFPPLPYPELAPPTLAGGRLCPITSSPPMAARSST